MAVNGFLASLLDRALGRAPTLQRRRPSVFEPIGPSRVPESRTDQGFGEEESLVERPARDVRQAPHTGQLDSGQPRPVELPRWPAVPRRDAPAWRVPVTRPESRSAHEEPAASESRPPAREREHAANSTPGSIHPGVLETTIHTRETIRQMAAPAARGEERKTQPLRAEAAAAPRGTRAAEALASAPSASKVSAAPAPAPAPARRLRPALQLTAPALVPKAPVPPIRPAAAEVAPARRAARAPQIAQARPAADAPVSVTIGSIEIRTAQPPAAVQPKTRPAGPKLNLDDYLAARHGGSR